MNRLILVFSALVLAVVPACDSDSDSSSGTNGSGTSGSGSMLGLDGGLALSDLTDEQQISACEASGEYFDNWEAENAELIARSNCQMSVTMMMDFGEEVDCQEMYDQCIAGEGPFAESDDEPVEEDPDSCDDQIVDLSECTEVTIADLETCQQAQLAMFTDLYGQNSAWTCDDLDLADPESIPSKQYKDMSEIPECADLVGSCPPMDPTSASSDPSGPTDQDLPIPSDLPEDEDDGDHEGEDHEDHDDDDMGDM